MVDESKKVECGTPGDPVTMLADPGKYTYKGEVYRAIDGYGKTTTPMPSRSHLLNDGMETGMFVRNGIAVRIF